MYATKNFQITITPPYVEFKKKLSTILAVKSFSRYTVKLTLITFVVLLFSSCVIEKEHIYVNKGFYSSGGAERQTIGCYYEFPEHIIMEVIKDSLGKNYTLEKDEIWEHYTWSSVVIPSINKNPLEVHVTKRMVTNRSLDNSQHTFESISMHIEQNGKDYLLPWRFCHRRKTTKFLVGLVPE